MTDDVRLTEMEADEAIARASDPSWKPFFRCQLAAWATGARFSVGLFAMAGTLPEDSDDDLGCCEALIALYWGLDS